MNFDFSAEQYALRDELRSFLAERSPLSACRKALEGGDVGGEVWGRELWRDLAALGWLGLAIPEEYGGSGLGPLMLALAAQEFGRVLAPVQFVTAICGATAIIDRHGGSPMKEEWLPAISKGEKVGALAWAERRERSAEMPGVRFDGARVTGEKIAVAAGLTADFAVASAMFGAKPVWILVRLDQSGVQREAARGLDPTRPVATLSFENADAELIGDGGDVPTAILRLAGFMAFEQIGGAEAVFNMTREYMNLRHAFGKPISSYQALKHRAADIYTAVELARSNAYYAAWAISAESPELAEAACSARIAASQAFELAATEAIQMHGGVGFTWESDCHLFYRRAKHLGGLLGSPDEWRGRLTRLLAA